MSKKWIPALLALALALSACGLHISIPITQRTGPTVTDELLVPVPDEAGTLSLNLEFGAGELKVHPGTDQLVEGTATYNLEDFAPEVIVEGTDVLIRQGNWELTGIPDFGNIENEWDLAIGNLPLDLEIEAGAYQAEYEFGGLSLVNLTIRDGAADASLSFAGPNPVEMNLLRYQTGASNVSLTGLANANFAMLQFESGAGNYTLDFSGELLRDASVNLKSGLSNLTLVIPPGIPVHLTLEGGLTNLTHPEGWTESDNVYIQEGSGPGLTIVVEMGAGNLVITP